METENRYKWLKEGDGNTKYFHASVKANRAKKTLDKLMDENGKEQRADALKGEVASAYFNKLFTSSNLVSFQKKFHDFQPRISEQMNKELIRRITPYKIKDVIFSINPSRAPGADGMTGCFFQHYWDVIRDQVTKEIQEFFEKGSFPP